MLEDQWAQKLARTARDARVPSSRKQPVVAHVVADLCNLRQDRRDA